MELIDELNLPSNAEKQILMSVLPAKWVIFRKRSLAHLEDMLKVTSKHRLDREIGDNKHNDSSEDWVVAARPKHHHYTGSHPSPACDIWGTKPGIHE